MTVWKSSSELGTTQLRRQRRVDGVGRPTFDFHTGMWADVGMLEGEMDQFLGLMPREIRWAMQGRPDKT